MYHPQNYYHQNLGTAGHRATSSYNYLPQYSANYPQPDHRHTRSYYSSYPQSYPQQQLHPLSNNVAPQSMMQQAPVQMPVGAPVVQASAPAEPAINGGINSVLEYDLNNMSTFLSWCTFGMLKQHKTPSKDFENLIVSVLFATRLPKSTIVIALEYMNQRFSSKKEILNRDLIEQEIFVYLVVALILANKFNDDNTFTNKSWCGATGLELALLNKHEKAWLEECKWSLNVVNFESNILTLEECWKTWLGKYGSTTGNQSMESSSKTSVSPVLMSSPASYNYPTSSPIQQSYFPQQYSSIPSSPVYTSGPSNTDKYYYPTSSPIATSPVKYSQENYGAGPVWPTHQHHQQQHPNIWNQAPSYQLGAPNFNNDPAVQYVGSNLHMQRMQQHIPTSNPNVMYPHPYSNVVGYANPYYNYNMASC